MSAPIRILLVDDHMHAREGMRTIVSAVPDFVVVGEASSGEEALVLTDKLVPDVILMDINMPGMGGLEAVKVIKSAQPSVKIIMVTVSDDVSHLFEALKKGAQGYLLKNLNPSSWRDYLRAVAVDEAPLNPELAMSILREFADRKNNSTPSHFMEKEPAGGGLTPREKEILQVVARGQTNREVAMTLSLSEHTVKNHLKSILHKLHLNNRVQLTRYAYESGMVERE
jgi:two-component system nitrate/nitrite response regulator NarL